jgi:hypothetical protein
MIDLDLNKQYDHIEMVNREQIKLIEIYKWIASERAQHDLGEEAILAWVYKYAPQFRKWAEDITYTCVHCREGCVNSIDGMCQQPFDKDRIKFLGKKSHLEYFIEP